MAAPTLTRRWSEILILAWLLPGVTATLDKSGALVIGLAAGLGGAFLVIVVLLVVVARKHRLLKKRETCESHCSGRQTDHANSNSSAVDLGHFYENVVISSSPEESRDSSRASTIIETEAEVEGTDVQARPGVDVPEVDSSHVYVNVPSLSHCNRDTSRVYLSADTPDSSEARLYIAVW